MWGARELERGAALTAQVDQAATLTIPALLRSFVPNNVFADLAGTRVCTCRWRWQAC